MAEIVTGSIHDYNTTEKKWAWRCGGCFATDNPPVALVGRKQSKGVCKKCSRINLIQR